MIGKLLDTVVAAISPANGLQRARARKILRTYSGAEPNRITSSMKPKNRSADAELDGAFGADALRAWSRMLVRDNPYAWGVVDTIVSSVIGTGIKTHSALPDNEELNTQRDAVWQEWCKNCDVNGEHDWHSVQTLVMREMVEAGECLVHLVNVPSLQRGIRRPVPFALELIEADRLASDRDTLRLGKDGNQIIRGVELDRLGKAVAYHVYPNHPDDVRLGRQIPVRLEAKDVLHIYRTDRVGQTRGVSWFAPVVSTIRDLGVYLENEMVASAVASCFTAAIKSKSPVTMLNPMDDESTTDPQGNVYDSIQPGSIMHLQPDEDITFGSPSRGGSGVSDWIGLIQRGIAVGTGLSYETVSRDYSKTNYSSNRASQLEDRRRFRCWQQLITHKLCQPVWDAFCEAAALQDMAAFPSLSDILDSGDRSVPVQFAPMGWEWVDPMKEQKASEAAILANQTTLEAELGYRGKDWKKVLQQRAREQRYMEELGIAMVQDDTVIEEDAEEVVNG